AAALLAEEAEPGTFSSLYCFAPVVWPIDDPPGPSYDNDFSTQAMNRRQTFASFAEAEEWFGSRSPFSELHPEAVGAYVTYGFEQLADGTVRLKCKPADEARVYAYATSHRAYNRLGEVSCPVTLSCGPRSDSVSAEVLEALGMRLRRRQIEVIEGVGHFGPLERPDLIADSMIRAADTPPA
ncbi:MAG: alpha/beta fold hydrolase, partial [Acidimicrobiales bacterium]